MKILKVHNSYLISGGEDQSNQAEIQLLREYGNQVKLYTENNERVKSLGLIKTATKTIWSVETYQKIRDLVKEYRPKILHCENIFPLISPSAYYAAKAEKIPVVQTLRNYRLFCLNAYFFRENRVCEDCLNKPVPFPGIVHSCYKNSTAGSTIVTAMLSTHRLLKTYQNQVDIFIALTQFAKQKFIEGGLPANKIIIKPNFVYPDPGMGTGEGKFALFVGRLSEEKGIETLLQAWQNLGHYLPLKIVGDGSLVDVVQDLSEKTHGVEYIGRKPIELIYQLMGQAKALIFPSLWYEGMPRVIIESFAKGTPVIASKLGAMEALVDNQRTGLHFTAGHVGELVQQVDWMLNHPSDWQKMRLEARLEYEAKYTAEKNYQRLMEIYQLAINSMKFK